MLSGLGAETKIRLSPEVSEKKLRDIVDNRVNGSVYTLNTNTGKVETTPIVNWIKTEERAELPQWMHTLSVGYDSTGGFLGIPLLRNTEVAVVPASCTEFEPEKMQYMKVSDIPVAGKFTGKDSVAPYKYLSYIQSKVNGNFSEFLAGIMAGQGCRIRLKNKLTGEIRLANLSSDDNILFKHELKEVNKVYSMRVDRKVKQILTYRSTASSELALLYNQINGVYTTYFLKNFQGGKLGLAFWSINSAIFNYGSSENIPEEIWMQLIVNDKPENAQTIVDLFKQNYGLDCKINTESMRLEFDQNNCRKLLRMIAPYIPKYAVYLFPENLLGNKVSTQVPVLKHKTELKVVPCDILELRPGSMTQMRNAHVYMLETNSENMFVGSVDTGILIRAKGMQK